MVVHHGSCLSTATKKAALRLTYLPPTKKLDFLHPTQDSNATPPTAIQPTTRYRCQRWPVNLPLINQSVNQSINQSRLHTLAASQNTAETLETLQQMRVQFDDVCAWLTSKESTILEQDRIIRK